MCPSRKCPIRSGWLMKRVVSGVSRSFASTLGHALGRGGLDHLLVLPDELGQVVRNGDVEPRDGAAAEVRARRRQLLELVQRVQTEKVAVRLRVGQVVPEIKLTIIFFIDIISIISTNPHLASIVEYALIPYEFKSGIPAVG